MGRVARLATVATSINRDSRMPFAHLVCDMAIVTRHRYVCTIVQSGGTVLGGI